MGRIEAYSSFWKEKVKEYGLQDGMDSIINILKDLDCNDYFELGIGTGWPIAKSLIDAGKMVYGCDLSSQSLLGAVTDYPQLYGKVYQGTVAEHEKQGITEFDCVYCIRSSWYMKDFPTNELQTMISITKPGGYIIFNIINRDSSLNYSPIWKRISKGVRIIIYRSICALKVILYDEDYSGQIKEFYYS